MGESRLIHVLTVTKGSSSTFYFKEPILGLFDFAWDDCDIETAAANGGISTVHYADYSVMQLLGLFGRTTVTAHGE